MRQSILSDTIRTLRQNAGLTQAEVSRRLNIQRQTYCNYENASRTPPIEILVAIAELYRVSVDYLIRGTGAENHAEAPAPTEDTLLDAFSSLSKDARKEVLAFIHFKKLFSD